VLSTQGTFRPLQNLGPAEDTQTNRNSTSPTSQVTCSRTQPSCLRCSEDSRPCVYSRTGSIPRPRKRKNPADETPSSLSSIYGAATLFAADEVQSHLATDIESTRGLLSGPGELHDNSLGALSSLSQACAAVWHSTSDFDRGKGYFLFEDRTSSWVDSKCSMTCIYTVQQSSL
jgi:hypothetical protein